MKYKYGERRGAGGYEKALIEWWKKERVFERSVERGGEDYVFYDGPPFITGSPHYGTLLSSIVKDAVPRYFTMRGRKVERRWGWDCHGLPAENFTEKHLGGTVSRVAGGDPNELELRIGDRVESISLERYIETARELMVANSATWEETVDRIGRWVDFAGAYKTMDQDYMESVWWAFAELYKKGKIYEGEKVLMYDTKFATPVSKNEVTMDNDAYRTVTDPSAYVLFENLGDNSYFMAWTTTPWTLPGNTALAVNPEMDYVRVVLDDEMESQGYILAKDCLERVMKDDSGQPIYYKITYECKGKDLIGSSYMPLFARWDDDKKGFWVFDNFIGLDYPEVKGAEFVGTEEGTGIVHIAPAYGEADFELAQEMHIPVKHVIDDNGYYLPEVAEKLREIGVRDTDDRGIEVWAGNKFIAKCLEEAGKVWKIDYVQHEYPFNPRSGQRIMYRAIPSWFFDVEGSKALMLEENEKINWFPEYLKHGRFAKNVSQAPDWNISRDRFWATALPVWKGDRGSVRVVGSYDELFELSGVRLEDYHRPWVDEVEFEIDGEKFKRVEKVLDCWFESGSMPFAQLHYPFENKTQFEKNYPADFIVEYVGQVRAWFYYVHAVNTALFGENAYRNVITTGTLAGSDGRKMSKSLGNFTDPNELMDKYSADALRFLLLSSPVLSGEDFALIDKDVSDVQRKLNMVWNVYDFFCMYAEVDGWEYEVAAETSDFAAASPTPVVTGSARLASAEPADAAKIEVSAPNNLDNPLDRWIVSRAYELRGEVSRHMEGYNLPDALSPVLPFVDDLSNWFVRRSRRRFWKSEDDGDKREAYETLHFVLSYLALVLAPFTPFLAEELWQKMVGGESVHLQDWPGEASVDQGVLDDMARCREIITEGLALRMNKSETEEQIKVRQPLLRMEYGGEKLDEFYEGIIAEEVNVKRVVHGEGVRLDKTLTQDLLDEGFARELIRFIQAARKKAGLNVDDRIRLSLSEEVPGGFVEMVKNEVLAVEMGVGGNYGYDEIVEIGGRNITISLEKA